MAMMSVLAELQQLVKNDELRKEREARSEERLTEAFLSAHMRAKNLAQIIRDRSRVGPAKAIVDYYSNVEAKRAGVPVVILMGPSRKYKVARARYRVWRTLRRNYGYSYPAIGRAFGRDHSTILMGLRKLEQLEAA